VQTYPKRESHFAIKFLHALNDAEIDTAIGERAARLLQIVVLKEDFVRYAHAPKFWQGQLMTRLGINCKKYFRRVRQHAIDSGLLHYASQGTRAQGSYWVRVPDWLLGRFPYLAEVNSCSASGSQTAGTAESIGVTDTLNQQESQARLGGRLGGSSPPNKQQLVSGLGGLQTPNQTDAAVGLGGPQPPNGQVSDGLGGALGGALGVYRPPPPIPTPKKEEEESPDSSSRDASEASPKRKKAYTDADRQTAVWMAELLRKSNPEGRKKTAAEIDTWANDIRLIRERDGKSDSDIRSLFCWANEDEFWSANILSPAKLRKQWDSLTAKRKSSRGATAATAQVELLETL
jgi:hypothetical protein